MPRNRTPVVNGTGAPLIIRVVSPTVKGLNAFEIGTLMPIGPLGPTVANGVPLIVEWIGRKWHSCQRRIEIRARIFKVAKYCQVLVANVAGERAVVHLTVSRRQRWRDRGEVIGDVIPVSPARSH